MNVTSTHPSPPPFYDPPSLPPTSFFPHEAEIAMLVTLTAGFVCGTICIFFCSCIKDHVWTCLTYVFHKREVKIRPAEEGLDSSPPPA